MILATHGSKKLSNRTYQPKTGPLTSGRATVATMISSSLTIALPPLVKLSLLLPNAVRRLTPQGILSTRSLRVARERTCCF